ncbi:hypothetical protein ABL78_6770 [Leptomonas seymouri]|uniref:C-type lectin domain-containing protein n=1 Tax=Leptomonas seymouri TaxID=5684 RepID=A0A0N1HTB7_LEPSE|nr:hypothetical protein ABL78_6770 [Leptomonas seymouri]|eukprot:KPI84181.1 hypothetical protein ABL78_6770 [Leptomonas seymouri]
MKISFSRCTLAHVAVAALLLLCGTTQPTYGLLYTTTLTSTQLPGVYTGNSPVGGLFTACENANIPRAPIGRRTALVVLTTSMTELLAKAVTSGQVYLAGYYNESTDAWYWSDSDDATATVAFARWPNATPVNNIIASNWAAGYPRTGSGSAVGNLKFVAYDASLGGWINIDGTSVLSGVACHIVDNINEDDKSSKFPWWAIVIIVLGAIVIVVVVAIAACCCRKKKKPQYTDEDDVSFFSRRGSSRHKASSTSTSRDSRSGSASFSSRETSSSDDSEYTDTSSAASDATSRGSSPSR